MTASELIARSMRLLVALGQGEQPSASESRDALATLNELLEEWALERLLCYESLRSIYTLTANAGSYTVGPTGTWVGQRPVWIDHMAYLSGTTEIPLVPMTDAEWRGLSMKALPSTMPTAWYYNPTETNGTVHLWPVPSAAGSVVLYAPGAPLSAVTLSTDLIIPPGYLKALRYNLAIDLSPEFGRPVSADVGQIAAKSKAALMRANTRIETIGVDPALLGGATFTILTGE